MQRETISTTVLAPIVAFMEISPKDFVRQLDREGRISTTRNWQVVEGSIVNSSWSRSGFTPGGSYAKYLRESLDCGDGERNIKFRMEK